MTYEQYIAKCEVAKTAFQCNVTAILSVDTGTPEQKLGWIAEDLKKLQAELEAMTDVKIGYSPGLAVLLGLRLFGNWQVLAPGRR